MYDDTYLSHYGVPGMKWGVRKAIDTHNARLQNQGYNPYGKGYSKRQKQYNNQIKKYKAQTKAKAAKMKEQYKSATTKEKAKQIRKERTSYLINRYFDAPITELGITGSSHITRKEAFNKDYYGLVGTRLIEKHNNVPSEQRRAFLY